MNAVCSPPTSAECPLRVVCRCLQVTESAVVAAVATHGLQTLQDIRRHTGAGDGCTACHNHLRAILEQTSSL